MLAQGSEQPDLWEQAENSPILGQFEEPEQLRIWVLAPEGKKCVRCWKYKPEVGQDSEHPLLCGRCSKAVRAQGIVSAA